MPFFLRSYAFRSKLVTEVVLYETFRQDRKICCPNIQVFILLSIHSFFLLLSFLDHALLGHAMDTFTIVDEFECQLKCIGNNSCKSVNVHPDSNNAQRQICELNSKTRQMKPGNFETKKGSTYYGSVQVS